ncbi:hypothetical protein [Ferrovum myxofaciens]|jgi:hypothetical protein|uniref:Uncharacterized protein n=1 Tax=Ferrovum myxofaciens TaxID=416213 RepID=A0A8F3DTU9_9PROT|nr:hypothetical protein [Ferrovum myxofaciens]KXW57196.1 hypothetical protein FEMY_22820 [Ferrovum myxofaciens]MBU6995668.1 hypothetical protein [Ferrovum myxofaciens]QKE39552.1 MAG: hypothetical protein HO273_13195 [Ferrovum myxofaciens]QKE42149.1 MAG: hypothetical protein HO274_13190 [Ferrovum myxofaciens]QWY74837.1 MAG: hypothetical protein JVY19_13755 [Ferrovum myxofaciens]
MVDLTQFTADMYDVLHWMFLRTADDVEQLLKPFDTFGGFLDQEIDKTKIIRAGRN